MHLVRCAEEFDGSCAGVGQAVRTMPVAPEPRPVGVHPCVCVIVVVVQAAQRLVDAAVALVGETEQLLELLHRLRLDDGHAALLDLRGDVLTKSRVTMGHHSS